MATWTDEAISALERMWKSGHTATEISIALGDLGFHFSRNAVCGQVNRLGLSNRRPSSKPWPLWAVSLLKDMWSENKPTREIISALHAKGFYCTAGAFGAKAYKLGLPPRKTSRSRAVSSPLAFCGAPISAAPQMQDSSDASAALPPRAGISLMDLEPWHCRMVVSENPYRFCGGRKVLGTSWCADCGPIVFTRDAWERMQRGRPAPKRMAVAA